MVYCLEGGTEVEFITLGSTGDVTVYARWDEVQTTFIVTASYTGGTTNMAASPANNATIIGFKSNIFSISLKGSTNLQEIGLNTAGQIRVYAKK
jgi:hypothetical protein